jgi:hypothetical protein
MKSGSFTADYLLAGADLRFALLQERILLPAISIGAGLNVMRGHIALGGMMNGPITLANVQIPMGPLYDISLTDPTLAFNWETTVVDFKVQISKSLIILTPYVGAAASYALSSTAGGGLSSSLMVDDGTGPHPPTAADISNIESYLSATGGSKVNLNDVGVTVTKSLRGSLAFRVFGGVSLNLLILKVDVGAMYNITSRSIGLSGNARLQL